MKKQLKKRTKNLLDEICIRMKADGSIFVDETSDGIVSTKRIKVDDLLNSLKTSIADNDIKVSSGILPKKCISYSENVDAENKYVVIIFDEGYADVTYMKTLYKRFPLPNMVFGYQINKNGRIYGVKIGVTANERLTEDSQMFIYPFSNVSEFNLCVGANRMPEINNISQLSNLPWFILGLPNNDDNFNERRNALRMGHRELYEHLKDKDTTYYYEKILLPMQDKTLKHFLNQTTN